MRQQQKHLLLSSHGLAWGWPKSSERVYIMSLHIEGRRWFQRSYGSTYNTVRIFKNGVLIADLPIEYGYGDYYLQRAHEWLGQHGYPELAEKYSNGMTKVCTTSWLRENGHSYSVIDVQRKKDL